MDFDLKWIFFDIGGTLIDETETWKDRLKAQVEMNDLDYTPEELKVMMENSYKKKKQNYRQFMTSLGYKNIAPYVETKEVLYPDTVKVLEALKKKYKLGIIANQSKGLEGRLKRYGILEYFDEIIFSDDVGYSKPDRKIFEYALEKCGAKISETMMVGDRIDNDIVPAKRFGMLTARIVNGISRLQTPEYPFEESDYTINTLSELLDILL